MSITSRLPARAGVGFKPAHFRDILASPQPVGFFEVHAENYMGAGGPPHAQLGALRERYALSIHGVGLSIGSTAPLDREHLARLKILCDALRAGELLRASRLVVARRRLFQRSSAAAVYAGDVGARRRAYRRGADGARPRDAAGKSVHSGAHGRVAQDARPLDVDSAHGGRRPACARPAPPGGRRAGRRPSRARRRRRRNQTRRQSRRPAPPATGAAPTSPARAPTSLAARRELRKRCAPRKPVAPVTSVTALPRRPWPSPAPSPPACGAFASPLRGLRSVVGVSSCVFGGFISRSPELAGSSEERAARRRFLRPCPPACFDSCSVATRRPNGPQLLSVPRLARRLDVDGADAVAQVLDTRWTNAATRRHDSAAAAPPSAAQRLVVQERPERDAELARPGDRRPLGQRLVGAEMYAGRMPTSARRAR